MAIVRIRLKDLPTLTEEQKARLKALEDFDDPMDDPDCPPETDEEHEITMYMMKKYNTRRITKEMYIAEGLYTPKSKSE